MKAETIFAAALRARIRELVLNAIKAGARSNAQVESIVSNLLHSLPSVKVRTGVRNALQHHRVAGRIRFGRDGWECCEVRDGLPLRRVVWGIASAPRKSPEPWRRCEVAEKVARGRSYVHVLDLCAGIGGMSLGLHRAVRGARTVCYVEREAFCVATLVAQMRAGRLDEAPVYGDLESFDGRPWRGVVDLVAAGFPCQPHSLAGKRRGAADERWLWDSIARIVREVRPGLVWLENVPGLLGSGLDRVLGSLAELGLYAEWDVLSAADVGAPHLRRRLFILAADPERGGEVADSVREGLEIWQGERGHARQELAPSERGGYPWHLPGPQPAVRRVADGLPARVDRLRALGNAVVPEQVAYAFAALASRLGVAA